MPRILRHRSWLLCALLSSGCAYEVGFNPDYVPPARPTFVADGALLVVIREDQSEYLYEGPPDSRVGDFTTLTIPLGTIIREIANDIFSSCFGRGVTFATSRDADTDYVLALEGDLDSFLYRYEEIVDRGFTDDDVETWIVPEVEIAFDARIYDSRGELVLDRVYRSGVVEGERYIVTARPAERINQVLHDTLHSLMLAVANDIYPLLIGECTVIDLDS